MGLVLGNSTAPVGNAKDQDGLSWIVAIVACALGMSQGSFYLLVYLEKSTLLDANGNLGLSFRVLDGIGQQVDEDLLQPHRVRSYQSMGRSGYIGDNLDFGNGRQRPAKDNGILDWIGCRNRR